MTGASKQDEAVPGDLPSFAEAVALLSAFLRGQGVPDHVVWVSRENVTNHRRRIWVRLEDADGGARHAAAVYHAGCLKGLGMSLQALCRVGSTTACYVWVPADEVEASQAMQAKSLKFLVPTPLLVANRVKSPLFWRWLRLLNSCRPYGDTLVKELPLRPVKEQPSVVP